MLIGARFVYGLESDIEGGWLRRAMYHMSVGGMPVCPSYFLDLDKVSLAVLIAV